MDRSRIFIASSVEGLNVAYSLQELLERDAECTVWDQGVFTPTAYAMNALIDVAHTSDFGIFVFSPDDTVKFREHNNITIRDNVVLELGLFLGVLAKEHCFIVMPRDIDGFHIPTDLAGLNPLTYTNDRGDNNLKAALGPCANQIRTAITRQGLRPDRSDKINDSVLEQIENARKCGLVEVISQKDSSQKSNQIIAEKMSLAKKINIFHTTGNGFLATFRLDIQNAVENGALVKILIGAKNSDFLNDVNKIEGRLPNDNINKEVDNVSGIVSDIQSRLSKPKIDKIELKYCNTEFRTTMTLIETGTEKWGKITLTLPPLKAAGTASFYIQDNSEGDTIFKQCKLHFDEVWKVSKT